MNWEYKAVQIQSKIKFLSGTNMKIGKVENELNELGSQGWELASSNFMGNESNGFILLIFKKPA